jgi:DNA helicase IV
VNWHAAGDVDLLAELVQVELDRILDDEGRDASGVCVATFRSAVRDHLREKLDLVSWENRGDGAVLCENVHRLKGLEFDTMILAAIDDVDDVAVLYVGVSRAVSELVVLGPPELADRLGLV